MRIQLSNGLFLDPSNPALLYDTPEENNDSGEPVKPKSLEKRVAKLERLMSQNPPYTIDDGHII